MRGYTTVQTWLEDYPSPFHSRLFYGRMGYRKEVSPFLRENERRANEKIKLKRIKTDKFLLLDFFHEILVFNCLINSSFRATLVLKVIHNFDFLFL